MDMALLEGPFETPERTMLELVGRLHLLGFPVRGKASLSPSGLYWRCAVDYGKESICYSTSRKWNLFGDGVDCSKFTLTELALRALPKLKVDPVTPVRPLWIGQAEEEDTLYADWFLRMLESTAPRGMLFGCLAASHGEESSIHPFAVGTWVEFSDGGGFEATRATDGAVEWNIVWTLWRDKRVVHSFLKHNDRHVLADSAKNGNWIEVPRLLLPYFKSPNQSRLIDFLLDHLSHFRSFKVKNILDEHPRWVNLARPSIGSASPSGYTLLHEAVFTGSIELVTMLLDRGAALSLQRVSVDGTPLQFAEKKSFSKLYKLLKPPEPPKRWVF